MLRLANKRNSINTVLKQITSVEQTQAILLSKRSFTITNNKNSEKQTTQTTIVNNEKPQYLANYQSKTNFLNNISSINVARFYSTKSKAKTIVFPALSPTMTDGNLIKWKKKEGDKITAGDAIAEIETDKATMDFEYEEQNGYLAKILVPEGSKGITVNTPIALIVSKKEDIDSAKDFKLDDSSSSTPAASTPSQQKSESAPKKSASAPSKSYPKHTITTFPALSPTMESGGLAKWSKKEGDKLSPGDIIAQVETDKATIDFEFQESGYLAKILVAEGTTGIPVDTPVCIVVSKKEDCDKFKDYTVESAESTEDSSSSAVEQQQQQQQPQQQQQQQPSSSNQTTQQNRASGERIFISPAAKVAASDKGIDYSSIAGTGPNNRIIKADILEYKPQQQQVAKESPKQQQQQQQQQQVQLSQNYSDIPHTNIRRVTAKRLTESKQTIPHYYLTMECRVDKLLKMRSELNNQSNNKFKLSINDFIIKAAAAALKDVPTVNSTWMADVVRRYHNIDINVAVNTEFGLFTPIIRDTDKRGLASISNSVKALAEKANANKLTPQEFETGTFTISNLGMFGIKTFSAVINPPQAAILAVGTTEVRYVPGAAGAQTPEQLEKATILSVTLSCDHRVIDGAIGAEWLQKFKDYMENPLKLLL